MDYTAQRTHTVRSFFFFYLITLQAKLRKEIPLLFTPMTCVNTQSYFSLTPKQVDHLVDSSAASLRTTLHTVAPLKKKEGR